METINIKTHSRNCMIDITSEIQQIITKSKIKNGICIVFVPHTTAAVTINENADPDVVHDVILTMNQQYPKNHPQYLHCEGNSDSHVKTSLFGPSITVIVNDSHLILGTWQSIYFCEFDGPRSRNIHIKIMQG
ncbi:MAG: YjbQ family protein [Phycisphaerae bacterium]|nr:YjbQ family protein [Phycisphaerae bacterium]